ncbi:MAG TPA: tripartite tricarboxylate transporter substrate binding protein [Xanthobacteraceae bacterium]|nr:tripartite tricarboxylate transporter substrate binding protein [Xanthobacteraceae bacterium]
MLKTSTQMLKTSTHKARLRRAALRCAAVAALLLSVPMATAHAADYPQRSVRFIIPFSAGGGADTLLRIMANALGERWGQTTIVENRVGGNTVVGTVAAISSPADGYTLFFAGDQSITINPAMMNVPYSVDKLTPITLIAKNPMLLVVTKSTPANNLKEFIALAKAKPKTILFGSSGAGSIQRLIMELMAQSAGIELVHVPYRGSNETVAGMLAGDINATFNGVSNFVQLLAADKLRALAVATDQRSSQLPNVPTVKEATDGQLSTVDTGSWFGLFAPAGTPDAIIQQVQKDVAAVIADPKVRKAMETRGFIPVGSTPAEYRDTIKKEAVQWQKVIKDGNIKPE